MPAVALTVDNLAEAADLGRGRLAAPLPAGRNPALDVGFPAILDLLDRASLPATWFVEGWNGAHHPDAVAEIERRGHTVGVHGWLHEEWSACSLVTETELLDRSLVALASATGRRPPAFRAPGGRRTPSTLQLLADRGVGVDASIAPDGTATHRPVRSPEGPVTVGFDWPLVDATYWLWDDLSPADGGRRLRAAVRSAIAAAGEGDIVVLVLHPHITGLDGGRVHAVEELVDDLKADGDVELVDLASL